MTTNKSIMIEKQISYELILLFHSHPGFTVKHIFDRLPEDQRPSLRKLYRYYARYKRGLRKLKALTREW
jgi:hypothetical protein